MGYLDLEGRLGGAFLHPGGRDTTRVLVDYLALTPGDRALELGCGVGATTALVAQTTGARLVALDRLPSMLAASQRRLTDLGLTRQVSLVQADASQPLPLADSSFDAVYAESVMALLPIESVVAECVRMLRPGGRLALTDRIWRSGLSQPLVDEVNARSWRDFGIPAATTTPLDVHAWTALLHTVGLIEVQAIPVDDLLQTRGSALHLRQRGQRLTRYLRDPRLIARSLHYKIQRRRDEHWWSYLESYLFTTIKPTEAGL